MSKNKSLERALILWGKLRRKDKSMKIPFSPPDITEAEIEQVAEALRSGWITTGPKTKEMEGSKRGRNGAQINVHNK